MMGQRIFWGGMIALVAGCQAPQATPPAAPATPIVAPPASRPADPRVVAALRLADEQAKAIAAMPEPPASGVVITDPPPANPVVKAAPMKPAAPVAPPAIASKPPGVAAVEGAIASLPAAASGDDGFRPVPQIITPDGKPFRPTITPPGGTPAEPPAVDMPAITVPAVEVPAVPTPVVTPPADVVVPPPSNSTPIAPPVEPVRPAAAALTGNDPVGGQLLQRARQYPRDLAPQLDAQLFLLLKNETVPTADAIAGLSVEDRDVLTGVLDGLSNFRNGIKQDANLLITRKIRPIVEMADRLRSRADLTIVNATLCKKIRGFGSFDPITPVKLSAGVETRPQLYYEIENITPRLDGNNMWTTTMQQDLVLYDGAGVPKWSQLRTRVVDVCRNRRRDFFFACVMVLPPTLAAGPYTLKITLTDPAAGRISEQSLPLEIAANNALPGGANNPLRPGGPSVPVGPPLMPR